MKQQKFITTTAAILMVCLLISGYYAVAAEYGSADDPLITQSYLDAVVTPKAVAAAETAADAQADTLSARISALSDQLDARITQAAAALASDEVFLSRVAAAGGTTASSGSWKTITLSAGQKVYLAAGAELVLRSGSATCIESGGSGLVNLSEVGEVSQGESLSLYHLYTATTQSSGLCAAERTKVLISGDYSIA